MHPHIKIARSLIGTPFKHRGRNPNIGLDCAGLPVEVLRRQNFEVKDLRIYSRYPLNDGLREMVRLNLGEPVIDRPPSVGDLALMRYRSEPHHIVIISDYIYGGRSIIHADAWAPNGGRVVEVRMDAVIANSIMEAYRWPV